MKLITFLMLLFLMQVSAGTHAQVTIQAKNTAFRTVLDQIRKQTGYDLIYVDQDLQTAHPVSLQLRNVSLEVALERVFDAQPLQYQLRDGTIMIKRKPSPPSVSLNSNTVDQAAPVPDPIRGRVVNEQGEPLAGATIYVLDREGKRTSTLTASDRDGNFQFTEVAEGVLLEITYLGYTAQQVSAKTQLGNVALAPFLADMQEVEVMVSTGYQQIPKERATGSFTHIDNQRFNEQVGSDILSRLPAIANGLIADHSTTSSGRLMIRGLSTISGPKEPLIILDNFPYEGDINSINPNDVQDITILKDAASASIWGVKAGNGVIVITTKKGKIGQKLAIDVSAHTRIGRKPNLFALESLSSASFIDVEEWLFDRGYYNSTINNRAKPPLTPIVELLLKKRNGILLEDDYLEERNRLITKDVRNDYLTHMYKPSIDQQYFTNLRGSSERHRWAGSIGFDNNQTSNYERMQRLTVRLDNQWRFTSKLTMGAEMFFTSSKNKNGRQSYGEISQDSKRLYPYAEFADKDGNPMSITRKNQDYLDEVANEGYLLDWTYFPINDYRLNTRTQSARTLIFNTNLNYKLSDGLSVTLRHQSNTSLRRSDHLYSEESFLARDIINSFSQIDRSRDVVTYIVPNGSILHYTNQTHTTHNIRAQLDYNKVFDKNEIIFLVGAESRSGRSRGDVNRIYGLNESNLSISNVDFTRQYPNVVTGVTSYIPNHLFLSGNTTRFLSAFANTAYTYADKYTLSGSLRRDATNLFGLSTRDKWNLLWSVGVSWAVSDEDFFELDGVDRLQVRATHGFSGNVDPSMSAVSTMIYRGINNFTNSPFARFQNYSNPDLKWESVATTNIGLDMDLWNKRVNVIAEYYIKRASDLFGFALVDPTAGVGSTVLQNVASMHGHGFDLTLSTQNISREQFRWDTDINLSLNRDRVNEYYLQNNLASQFLAEKTISGVKGRPVYSLYSFQWGGLDAENGNPVGYYDGNKSTTYVDIYNNSILDDLNFHGSVLPVWFGSMGNTIGIHNFNLSFRFVYKLGHFFRRNSIHYSNLFRQGVGHPDYENRWQNPGDELYTEIPAIIYPAVTLRDDFYRYSSPLVERADHIRLQYINFSYILNNIYFLKKHGLQGSAFFNMDNVGIIWRANEYGIDPDFYSDITPPPARIFSLGFRFNM